MICWHISSPIWLRAWIYLPSRRWSNDGGAGGEIFWEVGTGAFCHKSAEGISLGGGMKNAPPLPLLLFRGVMMHALIQILAMDFGRRTQSRKFQPPPLSPPGASELVDGAHFFLLLRFVFFSSLPLPSQIARGATSGQGNRQEKKGFSPPLRGSYQSGG